MKLANRLVDDEAAMPTIASTVRRLRVMDGRSARYLAIVT